MTGDFAAKSRRNYFATKLYLTFTWITLTRLLKTLSKIRLLLLKMLNQTEKKDYNEWQRMTTSDNKWQRVVQRVITSGTANDNEWQRVTTNGNEWQRMTTSGTTSDNDWQRVTILAKFSFFQVREEPTTKHP